MIKLLSPLHHYCQLHSCNPHQRWKQCFYWLRRFGDTQSAKMMISRAEKLSVAAKKIDVAHPQASSNIRKKTAINPGRRFDLLHDRTEPHREASEVQLLMEWDREVLAHPPYSRNLSRATSVCLQHSKRLYVACGLSPSTTSTEPFPHSSELAKRSSKAATTFWIALLHIFARILTLKQFYLPVWIKWSIFFSGWAESHILGAFQLFLF